MSSETTSSDETTMPDPDEPEDGNWYLQNWNHDACSCRVRPTLVQTILSRNKSGRLSFSPPPPRRTPLSNAVHLIANTPLFSTTYRTLTTFLRFPPEIRLQVYRLLLSYDGVIQYAICRECCKMINGEGSRVLYGENRFKLADCHNWPVLETYNLAPLKLGMISKLSLDHGTDPKYYLALLPGIRDVKIYFDDVSSQEWERSLIFFRNTLRLLQKVEMVISIPQLQREGEITLNSQPVNDGRTEVSDEEQYTRGYKVVLERHAEVWKNRNVRWKFDEYSEERKRNSFEVGEVSIVVEWIKRRMHQQTA